MKLPDDRPHNLLIAGVGGSGLRFVITLGRVLDATHVPPVPDTAHPPASGHTIVLRDVTFAYGPHAEPVVNHLDLTVPEGEQLAIVGPSGIGKSTVASLVCGLLRPDLADLGRRARARVLEHYSWEKNLAAFAPLLAAGRMLYFGPWVAERLVASEALLARAPEAILPVTRGIIESGW